MGTVPVSVLVMILFIALMSIAAMVICTLTFFKLCMKDSSEWINATYRNLTMVAMILYTLSTVGDCAHLLVLHVLLNDHLKSENTEFIVLATNDGFYFLGNFVFYTLILLRVAKPFTLNKCVYYFIISLICIAALSGIIFCGSFFYFDLWTPMVSLTTYLILSVDDFILNFILLIIFIHKMRTTVQGINRELSNAAESNVNLVMNTMIKHSVLFGIVTIASQAWIVSNIVGNLLLDPKKEFKVIYAASIYSIRALENIINVVVLWLVLRINYNKYISVCKCCHLCVAKCCMKEDDTSLDNPYYVLQNL